MDKKFEVGVREELKRYVQYADDVKKKIEINLSELASELEICHDKSLQGDVSIEGMDEVHKTKTDDAGNALFLSIDNLTKGQMICAASGVARIPLSADSKKRLKCYEAAAPTMIRMYDNLEYVDELWFFDRESNLALGRIEYDWADFLGPGLDFDLFYPMNLAYYDWFKMAGPDNPDRQVVISESPFVEMFNQWILHLKAPVYRNRYKSDEVFLGIAAAHLRLPWLMRDTIDRSNLRIMVVKDNSTLVAMNDAAKRDINLETFDPSKFSIETVFYPETGAFKRKLVSEILNLEYDKPEDVLLFAQKIKSEYDFIHTLQGKKYRVIKEKSGELGLFYLALLDLDQ